MRHVISSTDDPALSDPAFWTRRWRGRFAELDPNRLNPILARRSAALWDPLELGRVGAEELRSWIEDARVPDAWWAALDGRPASEAERAVLLAERDLEGVRPYAGDRPALALKRTNLRALPTDRRGHKLADEEGFDRLQHTALEPLTPLALLHPSRGGDWWFAQAPDYRGWVHASEVALCPDPATMRNLLEFDGPVLLDPRAELVTPQGFTTVQTGTRLPGLRGAMLPFPARDPGGRVVWSKARLVGEPRLAGAYPELEPQTLFEVALAALGEPYGWGDLTPEGPGRDCSRFVQDVFKAFGVRLPRDASRQCAATRPALRFQEGEPHETRAARLARLASGPALLCMPGHVMLYLGAVDGCHHAVHAFWAYKRPQDGGVVTVPVRRVVVTSLDLGRGTPEGSLLERLTSVNLLGGPDEPVEGGVPG
ncbi:SH3 domain-containing protein [Oceanithermus sp.]